MPLSHSFEERILILAPTGKDASLLSAFLDSKAMKNEVCSSLREVAEKAAIGVGAIVIAEEAFTEAEIPVLKSMLESQPHWSDVPVVILTSGGEADQTKLRLLNTFGAAGNLTLIARPLHTANLLSILQVALRARRRQYEVRELLAAQKKDHEKLLKITEDLAKSNSSLEHFASIASHDLQEPLRKIRSFTDRLKAKLEFLGETERDYFNRIDNAAGRMAHLIDSLLGYSKISSDTTVFQEVDLAEVMAEVLSDLEIRILESEAAVHVPELPTILANRFQMRQLFQNLIANAIKYARAGVPPEVTITCQTRDGRLLLGFQDNGIGFEEKYVDRIFKPFQRLHGKHEYEGTGMGLAICDKIVRLHAGQIIVHSTPGKGSLFIIDLPENLPVSI